eukprot:COSAG01_NODE_10361_length_2184_cov_2.861391_1_plen_416_part_10
MPHRQLAVLSASMEPSPGLSKMQVMAWKKKQAKQAGGPPSAKRTGSPGPPSKRPPGPPKAAPAIDAEARVDLPAPTPFGAAVDEVAWADRTPSPPELDGTPTSKLDGPPPQMTPNLFATADVEETAAKNSTEPHPQEAITTTTPVLLKAHDMLYQQTAALRQNSATLALRDATRRLRPPTLAAPIGRDADTPLTSQHFLVAVEQRVLAIEKERVLAIEKVRAAVERIDRGFSDEPVLIETKAARRARRRLRDGISLQWDSRAKPEPRRFDAAAVIQEVGRMIRDAGKEPWFQTSDPDQNQVQTPSSGDGGTAGVVYGVDLRILKGQSASGGILSIKLFGEGGDSGAHQLVKEWHGPVEGGPGTSVHTQQMFTINAAELGELNKLEIVHSSPGTAGAQLFVQQVVILHPLLPDAHFV